MASLMGRIGQVFAEPLLALMAALDAHQDHLLVPAVQEILQTPAFAVGGILIEKEVVTVEKVHHGIMFPAVIVVLRQVNVQRAVLSLGGVDKISLDDHSSSLAAALCAAGKSTFFGSGYPLIKNFDHFIFGILGGADLLSINIDGRHTPGFQYIP